MYIPHNFFSFSFCLCSQLALKEHGCLDLSPGFTDALLRGIDCMKQWQEGRDQKQLEKKQKEKVTAAKRRLTKEERLAREVLRMYKSWNSTQGIEMTYDGFFPPEMEYVVKKAKRPAAERRINETGSWFFFIASFS